ncbi:response regulator [Phenylobacterium sp. LjRoot219]|uniref:response regulator n=1 Tax=Phenylobacterium sp. LjRoot219 TaxID=3342283 RepID=UPI003ECE3C59
MGRILLVEDEVFIAEMIEEALEDRGFQVRSAHTDRSAYAILDDEAHAFTLLIADVNLGVGTSGFDVARRARELNPELRVIYISGHAAHLQKMGVADSIMFPKPFYPEELADQVVALLQG